MAERIDHKYEAEALTDLIPSDWQKGDVAVAQQTEALVHATLYLADQQRIANLIAIATWNDEALRYGRSRAQFDAEVDEVEERARVDGIFKTVREGLGLS